MYAQQSAIDPSLAALLQTAQMVTPDQTPTVAAQVAQAAQQKMQPQGIMQGMPQARQDYANAAPSMMRNMQQQQMQQMVRQAMQPQPAGIEGLPAPNMQGMAEGGVVGFASRGYVNPEFPEVYETTEADLYPERLRESAKRKQEEEERRKKLEFLETVGAPQATQYREPTPIKPSVPAPQLTVGNAPPMAPEAQRMMDRRLVPAPRPPAPAPRPPAPAPSPSAQSAPTGVAALAAQPKMDLSRYEKAGAEDRAAMEKIIAAQEANAAAKAAYMSGRPKFEQEGIAALTKANQAREEMLAKERADDAYRRQQALLDQIGRRNLNAYSQEEARQRQRDLSAAEAQRLYEQAVIKQREAEFLQGAGRFEEAKKALDDKEKILSAMQTRLNQSRETEARIAERQFASDVQMFEGAQNRANSIEVERLRRATASMPGETERIHAEFNRRKAIDPADAEQYLQNIERIKGLGKPTDRAVLTYAQAAKNVDERLSDFATQAALKKEEEARAKIEKRAPRTLAQMREELIREEMAMAGRFAGSSPTAAPSASTQLPSGVKVTRVGP
jgi:hypothetical protein